MTALKGKAVMKTGMQYGKRITRGVVLKTEAVTTRSHPRFRL